MKNKQKSQKNSKNKKIEELSPAEYERLGRQLAYVYETGFINKKRMMKLMFFRGVLTGLGTVIGATVVVALIYWILSLLTDTPFLGPILEYFQTELGSEVETLD
jgi:hypothetical protein